MLLSDDLARFPRHLDSAAVNVMYQMRQSYLMNEINMPVFRTNTLILEFLRQTVMKVLRELQGLARTSPPGVLGMDEL